MTEREALEGADFMPTTTADGDPVDTSNTEAPDKPGDIEPDESTDDSTEDTMPSLQEWVEAQPTREAWLYEAAYAVCVPLFTSAGYEVPAFRISCGWTGAGDEGCTLGVCYAPEASKSKTCEIFVSPTLDNGLDVVCVMLHEMAHAVAGVDKGHDIEHFGEVCKAVGLTNAGADHKGTWPTQAYPGKATKGDLAFAILAHMRGEVYPHAALIPPPPKPPEIVEVDKPTQTTRMLKAVCEECGYVIRVTMKWAARGMPVCGTCSKHFVLQAAPRVNTHAEGA